MIEQEYLKYCLEKIEQELNWKPSTDWKESDFIRLSRIISEKSSISISPHTLKRLFGKIKYKKYYNPQQATKDALAKFLDYSDWRDFVKVLKQNNDVSSKEVSKESKINKGFLFGLVLVLMGSIIAWYFYSKPKAYLLENKKDVVFEFAMIDSVGVVPYTVSVNYNLSKVVSDSTFIDFGFNHPVRGRQSVLADKSKFVRNFTYQIPGQYTISLVNDEKALSSSKVLAMSDDWDSYFNPETATGNYWIDNKIEKDTSTNNLYYPPKYLDSVGFETNQVYYVTHRLFKEFDIDGDNFELTTRFKNSEELGGITCYDFILRIICENEINNIKLMENGCSQFSGMKMGETVLSGDNEDLSSFKFDLGSWNDLKISVDEKSSNIYINNIKIHEGLYKQSNGKIVGLEVILKGAGMLDLINIKDLNSQKTYTNDF
ncbi:hypothetical protein [Seonamhaeicola maritimus]|uniref:PKD domain-containing protein n=1 Tax=Seonamhaeicola maritimus TaxID=2591822 RepID=A0A5C7GJF0_9FLAO|nr:hypothetical protein [Seonamhaeicola maritimus]TXG38433.1 hypothetical protein FUA22_00690 [Seonamhaeicola maritimus]